MSQQQDMLALAVIEAERGVSPSSSGNPGQITDTLKKAMERGHLVSPATTCPNLPPGTEVAVSAVLVDTSRETYRVQGGAALTKSALERISKAVGVSWNDQRSRRTDNGDDPCFASYKAVGHFRDFDGTWRTIEGDKQMDLRDGSERAKTMKAGELSEARKFIAEHAQTKARLRAIRSLGIRSAYTDEELDKPFICARLIFTGYSEDPETRKIFAQETARAMMSGAEMLYGVDESRPTLAAGDSIPADPMVSHAQRAAEPEVLQCTPDKCYGRDPRAEHVNACYTAREEKQTEPGSDWVIPKYHHEAFKRAAGLKISDPKVQDTTLVSMRNYYISRLDPNSDAYADLTDEAKDRLQSEMREVVTELRRRGIKDDGSH